MKKNTLRLLSLCAIFVAALPMGGRQAAGGTAATEIAYLVSTSGADFSDLDARDIQNQPISSPSDAQDLVTLFRENLVDLTVFAAPHQTAAALAWLDSISRLFNNTILKVLVAAWDLFQDALMPPNRRFVHNVNNLCATFSVGVLSGCLLLSAFGLQRIPQNVHLRL